MSKILTSIATILLLTSCTTPERAFIEAERTKYESLAPWIEKKADTSIPEDKAKIDDLKSWDINLTVQETKAGIKKENK